MKIKKIISGGQTGADRGGLESAIECNLEYGGYIPLHRKAEDGIVPLRYVNMVEIPSNDYKARTKLNVQDSDVTLIFCHGAPKGGSKFTVDCCKMMKRDHLVIDLDFSFEGCLMELEEFFQGILFNDLVVNIAGTRESHSEGIQVEVKTLMSRLVKNLNMNSQEVVDKS